jgi:RNA polymerase sigma-70 factor (ECF subfamily)
MNDTTSSDLLDAVRRHLSRTLGEAGLWEADDQQAWDAFYEHYHEVLIRFARKLQFRADEIEDLLQEVWCEVIRQLPRFEYDRTRGGFRRWLYIIVRRRTIDHARQRAARGRLNVDAGSLFNSALLDPRAPNPSDDLDRQFKTEILHAAIGIFREQATPAEWDTFSLCRLKGLSSAAAAEALGTTPEAVRKRLERISVKLRTAMTELVGVGEEFES